MIDEDLKAAAFRKEIAKAKRRSQNENLSENEALRLLLEKKANGRPFGEFLAERRRLKEAEQERVEAARKADADAWHAWFDGAAEPNPGARGIGAVLKGPNGEIAEISQAIGFGTNNEAEYQALIAVLEEAAHRDVHHLIVQGDSQLVINQVDGTWGVKAPGLWALCERAQVLVRRIGRVRLSWIPREQNREADALSKQALGFACAPPVDHACWTNQTTIAKTVGLSAIALGKLIDAAGLRADGKPTQDALDTGAARVTHNGFGMQVAWHKTQLLLVLRERGQLPIKP